MLLGAWDVQVRVLTGFEFVSRRFDRANRSDTMSLVIGSIPVTRVRTSWMGGTPPRSSSSSKLSSSMVQSLYAVERQSRTCPSSTSASLHANVE